MVAPLAAGTGYVSATPRQRAVAAALAFAVYLLLLALLSWRSPPPVRPIEDPVTTVALLPHNPPPPPAFEPPPAPKPKRPIDEMTPDRAAPSPLRAPPAPERPRAAPPPTLPAPEPVDITPVRAAPPVTAIVGGGDKAQGDAGGASGTSGTGERGGGPAGDGAGGAGSSFVRARWVELLGWSDIHRFHPASALARGISGRATVTCQVHRSKRAYNCRAEAEAPLDEGFGAAAVAMAPLYRIEPRRVDGKTIDDGRVIFTVHFYATIAEAKAAGVPSR